MITSLWVFPIVVMLLGAGSSVMAEVVVVANKSASLTHLNVDQVKSIFLKKTDKLPDGTPVVVMDLPRGNEIRNEFYRKTVKKTSKQLKAYWAKRIFAGRGVPNEIQSSESAVKRWISRDVSHIGYISAGAVDGSVKVLLSLP